MKYLIVIMLMAGVSLSNAQSNAISKYFEQYVDDDRFTSVFISPKMFQMFSKLELDEIGDEETEMILDVVKDLRGLRILTTDIDAKSFYKEAKRKIDTKEYEVLMTVRNQGEENVEFLIKDEGDIIKELLLLVDGDDEFVLLSFVGNIDLQKISKLSKSMDVKGMEHLDKIEEENRVKEGQENEEK